MKLEIIDNFNDNLMYNWKLLFLNSEKKTYNLHPDWCLSYFNNFLKNDTKKIYILSVFNGSKLISILPLVLEKNKILIALGSTPKIYDSFSILSTDANGTKIIVNHLIHSKYKIHFDLLNTEDDFTKLLILEFMKNKIKIDTEIRCLKPYIKNEMNLSGQFLIDTKRQIKKITENINENLVIQKMDSNDDFYLFKKWYNQKYPKGLFKKNNFESFLKSMIDQDLYRLYKLKAGNKILSYMIVAVNNQDENLTMLMNSSDPIYFKYGVGRSLIYLFLINFTEHHNQKEIIFDFGTGHENYKYEFTKKDNIMINISTFKISWIIKLIRKFVRFII